MSFNENNGIQEELLIENTDFLKAVSGATTLEEAQSICTEYNIVLPEDMWKDIQLSYYDRKLGTGELDEEELEAVSGGIRINGDQLLQTAGGIVGLGAVIAAGSPAGVLVACAWIGYHGYKTFR